ncbi:T9SS type A sorting domain-containing protein [Saprospira grandis]|uniref:T9SS type A sorting domain-containing protein n=1 Tax=Saprospira grandis TaxID=1008 RepID=UPI0022DE82D6|nr:T9SS type A sorting domain-containing protein [Saprospira grandis]WBM76218.1 T9SS type A sorting domain-containing protein [Saprospira grandis]
MTVRILLSLLFLWSSLLLSAQQNLSFEDWAIDSQGIEQPLGWQTNNLYVPLISVNKSSLASEGQYSVHLSSNAFPPEGRAPGHLYTSFSLNQALQGLSFDLQVDSLRDGAYIELNIQAYQQGQLVYADTVQFNRLQTNWSRRYINIPPQTMDSFRLEFIAKTFQTGLGYEGYASCYIDDIRLSQASSIRSFVENTFSFYPRPAQDRIWLKEVEQLDFEPRLYSLQGQLIRSWSKNSQELDILGLAAGQYLLVLQTAKGAYSQILQVH